MTNRINHSPAEIIRQMLIDRTLGTDPDDRIAWPVFASGEPTSPDNCITVYDTQGQDQGRTMVDGRLHQLYGLQVRVRAKDHSTGWLRADAIRWTFSQDTYQETVRVGSTLYLVHAVCRIGPVLALGKDSASKRSVFTINALASIELE